RRHPRHAQGQRRAHHFRRNPGRSRRPPLFLHSSRQRRRRAARNLPGHQPRRLPGVRRMIVLAIDTCGPSGSVSLGRVEPGDLAVLAETELPGKFYSAQLVPAIRAMLAAAAIDTATLDAIVIVNGPGSFTGIRVGVSTAKGLAQALYIPLLAVSRLAVLASKAATPAAALDAGRRELYFRDGEREMLVPAKTALLTTPGALAVCEPDVHWFFPDAVLTA